MTHDTVFDGHLDLAMNALDYERDQMLSVEAIRSRETPPGGDKLADGRGTAMVSLPELRAGGVKVVTATVLARAKPWIQADRAIRRDDIDWPSRDMAHAVARGQLAYYELLQRRGEITLIKTRDRLNAHLTAGDANPAGPLGVILMMEGADPITHPAEIAEWYTWGVRCLSLAHFGHSHYACGTPPKLPSDGPDGEQDGPLPPAGRELLREMSRLPGGAMALDLTHLSDRSFMEAIEAYEGPVCATHSDCRALSDTVRQLTDEQIRQIIERDGVVGIAIHNSMLAWNGSWEHYAKHEDVGLSVVADHVMHICTLAGNCNHVGLGSDLDGGYGREKTPRELDTHRDLRKLTPLLRERGLSDADVERFFSGNWLRFWRRVLPE